MISYIKDNDGNDTPMITSNTDLEFFAHWSRASMVAELVRLNRVLKEVQTTLNHGGTINE
jgi:hypothetical protein